MYPVKCVICGKPCSRKNGDHWHLCKECNDKYWTPHKDDYTYSSFLDTIEHFKDDYKNEQDNFWKELGLDDSEDNSNDGMNKLQHTSTLDKR